ncbi:MAG TPA: DUF4831 family protein [Phycisphaerae bacterium]|nr:DUF4831 family protein [Phycisphaerae bacterium]
MQDALVTYFDAEQYVSEYIALQEIDGKILELREKLREARLSANQQNDVVHLKGVVKEEIDALEAEKKKFQNEATLRRRTEEAAFEAVPNFRDTKSVTRFKIGSPELSTTSEPDHNHVYVIELKTLPSQNRYWYTKLTELGIIVNAKSSLKDRTPEYVVATAAAAFKIAGALEASPGLASEQATDLALTTPFDKAKVIADRINELEGRREDLLVSESAKLDPETLKARMEAIDKAIADLTTAFYAKEISAGVVHCTVLCGSGGANLELVNLHEGKGFTLAADAAAASVQIPRGFGASGSGGSSKTLTLSIARSPDHQSAKVVQDALAKSDEMGIWSKYKEGDLSYRYRIPALGRVQISLGDDTLADQRIAFAQFGAVYGLPSGFSSFDSSFENMVFSEITGALREIEAKTTALDPKLITDLGDAATEYAKALAAQNAAADGPSGLAQFKSRLDELVALLPMADALGVPIPAKLLALANKGGGEDKGKDGGSDEGDGDGS